MKAVPDKKSDQAKAATATGRAADDTLTLHLKDLEAAQRKFDGMIERSAKLRSGRSAAGDLPPKLADDLAGLQRAMREAMERHAAELESEITDRRRAEAALASSQVGLQRAQLLAKLAHVITGADGSFEAWSDTLPLLIGVPAADMPRSTREWLKLVHAEDQGLFRGTAIEAGVEHKHKDIEYRLKRARGWIHVRQSMEPLDEEAGAGGSGRWFNTLQDITEQKTAAEESHRFRLALDNSADMIVIMDRASMRIIDVNQTSCRLLGYTREELLRMGPADILPVSRGDLEKAYDELIANPSLPSGMESYYRRKDGSRLPFESTRHVFLSGGKWLVAAISRDSRERDAAVERQRSAKQLLDNIVENIPTAVQLKSVEDGYRVVMWNKAAEAMYGLPREEAIGRNVHDLWPKAEADRFHAADLDLMASGRMQDFPNRPAQTKDRGEIRVHMRKVALFDAAGKATHLLVIADDMTAQLADQARLRESEERFRSLTALSSDWFWAQDEEYRFVNFSGGDSDKGWGKGQSATIGMRRWELPGVSPVGGSWDEHKALLAARKPFRDFEYQRAHADGAIQYIAASGEPVFDADGRFAGYRGVATDITKRKGAEERIGRLNRVHAVLSGINGLIVRVHEREALFNEACRLAVEAGKFKLAWIGMVDRDAAYVTPVAWHGVGADYIKSMPVEIPGATRTGRGLAGRAVKERKAMIVDDMATDERITLKKESLERGFHSLVILPLVVADEAVGVLALYAGEIGFFDQEEMKLLDELAGDIAFAIDHIDKASRLDYLAYYDELTGLANRTHFHESLGQHLESARRGAHKLAVQVLDIDRFKNINDSFGREAGDELLRQVAQRMRQAAADPSSLARISADRFAMVRPIALSEDEVARHNEQKLEQCFGTPYRVGDTELRLSARVGIAMFPADGSDADTLFKNAEAALKKAKATGERTLFYAQEMTERVAEKLALENKLRQALEKEEFVLHYQLKVDAETRKVLGVEALIRWQSAEGLVPPGHFIPLMEETGIIRQAGAWALRRAVLDHRHWLRMGITAPRVAVNVSPIQLRQQDFVDTVKEAIAQGANPTGLDLEITESLIMEDVQGNIRKLKAIRDLGVSVAIDDFGTGYSSLAYLARLPVETLKIDRSFIIGMMTDPNTMMLIQTMITLAHSLRLKVVAEGVETEDQAKMLRLLRCDELQGYLISKPVPIEVVTPLLLGHK